MKHSKHESKGVQKIAEKIVHPATQVKTIVPPPEMTPEVAAATAQFIGDQLHQTNTVEPHSVQPYPLPIAVNVPSINIEPVVTKGSFAVSEPAPEKPQTLKTTFVFTFADGAVISKIEAYGKEWEVENAMHGFATNGVSFVNSVKGITTFYPAQSIQKIEYRIEKEKETKV